MDNRIAQLSFKSISFAAKFCQPSAKKPRMAVRSTVSTGDTCRDTILEWICWSFRTLRVLTELLGFVGRQKSLM